MTTEQKMVISLTYKDHIIIVKENNKFPLEKCIKGKNRIHRRNTNSNIYMEEHLMSL